MVLIGSAEAQGVPTRQREQQILAVVAAARSQVEFHGGQVRVLVVGPEVDEGIGTVLRRALGAILPNEVPRDGTHTLPSGYLLLTSLSIDGEKATFAATLGPVPAPREGVVPLACGTTFTIAVTRMVDRWVAKVTSLIVC